MQRKIKIGVMGAAVCNFDIYELAYQTGKEIAKRGAILISGGRTGVMEASAKGTKEAGGLTIGISPYDKEEGLNKYIDIPIITGMGMARNVINILSSDAIIAISGGYGTLSEIAFALKLKKFVVGIKTWDLSREGFEDSPLFLKANSVKEALDKIFNFLQN